MYTLIQIINIYNALLEIRERSVCVNKFNWNILKIYITALI